MGCKCNTAFLTLLTCLIFPRFGVGEKSFLAWFQPEIKGSASASSDVWMEFSNPIPQVKEFTICQWLYIKFFSRDIAACLGSYCTIEHDGDKMECLQFYMNGVANTANRNLQIVGEIKLRNYKKVLIFSKQLKLYLHRSWSHYCWSFSAKTGISQFYHNGRSLGVDRLNVTDTDVAMKASNETYDAALIFGQEPDAMRGGFESDQVFIGQLMEFNIWNYLLDDALILEMSVCTKWPRGNIVSWNKSDFELHNVHLEDFSNLTELCAKQQQYVLFPEKMKYPDAQETCKIHGGSLALPRSEMENNFILNIVKQPGSGCIQHKDSNKEDTVWIGAKKFDHLWYSVSTNAPLGQRLNYTKILQFSSKSYSDCALLRSDGAWLDRLQACYVKSLCTLCEIKGQPVFTLKGICYSGDLDWNYYLSVDDKQQIKAYEGYKTMDIIFDKIGNKWKFSAKEGHLQELIHELAINSFTTRYPIGRKEWLVKDPACQVNDSRHQYTLSICTFPTEFTCDSGQCIDIKQRCDEQQDCSDGSDEKSCQAISVPSSYNKANAPTKANAQLLINVQANVTKINLIDTINMVVTLTLKIGFQWHDERLQFLNPTPNKNNLIPKLESDHVWNPLNDLIYENAIIGEIKTEQDYQMEVMPIVADAIDPSYAIENSLFNGKCNPMELKKRLKIKYSCLFDVRKFPFDQKICEFKMKINQHGDKRIKFIGNGDIEYTGSQIVGEFSIGKIESRVEQTNTSTKYVIILPLKRQYTNRIFTTFIPTFVLWLFGYATLFIKPDENGFNNRFMGSGTALLVMVTLLNAVNEDLPKTSYMKFIDAYFLYHVITILVIILYHIILDRIRAYFEAQNESNDVVPFTALQNESRSRSRSGTTGSRNESRNGSGFGKWITESDVMVSLKMNSLKKVNQINNCSILVFPALNGLFYGIYFYITMQ